MEHNHDKDHFTFNGKQAQQMIKKAKLRSTLRTIGIIIVVTPVILAAMWYGLYHLRLSQGDKVQSEILWRNEIGAPNVHISNQSVKLDAFGGEVYNQTYKWLGNKPYVWETLEEFYNLSGRSTGRYGAHGAIPLPEQLSAASTYRYNSATGDREMFFYHPQIQYTSYEDSISQLKLLEDNMLVELALSFDRAYKLEEMQTLLPAGIQPVWYWTDAYTNSYKDYLKETGQTIAADSQIIYGFHGMQFAPYGGVDAFINSVEQLRAGGKNYKWAAEQIQESLAGDNNILEPADITIIGVVVTGTAKQLETLQNQPYIKASTFGVVSKSPDIPS
ncbi:anti sigma factor C-terminal domain-containing protein [Paenibacillus sp. MMS20-IR301]|uniref:anti sigma factor C-terminal domain-containing protein n=1 Tax=Paenibacillus sp. MMS20-IR301 TaxID=2895946 RepID=UPI0028E46FE1|nr:anti sigma factor C-terminal domain-containing protein [Paenibacillus sp. MMS20-IR301]WNS44637.1 anti sigma factor C-terminal domain-containing protein [Paenibacillus sp. MMS20-IR301]